MTVRWESRGSIKLDLVVLVTDEFSYGVSKVSER
jgi:hypothetical protein